MSWTSPTLLLNKHFTPLPRQIIPGTAYLLLYPSSNDAFQTLPLIMTRLDYESLVFVIFSGNKITFK